MTNTDSLPAAASMLGRVVLLVREYDEALQFYSAALDARVIYDHTVGGQRFLHLELPAQPNSGFAPVGLWLLQASGDELALVGRQAGTHPFLVLYSLSCHETLERFLRAGGELRRPIREDPGATFAHVADLYGNELVLVQLRDT